MIIGNIMSPTQSFFLLFLSLLIIGSVSVITSSELLIQTQLTDFSFLYSIVTILVFLILSILYIKEYILRKKTQKDLVKETEFFKLAIAGGNVYAFQFYDNHIYFDPDFYKTNKFIGEHPLTIEELRSNIHPDDTAIFDKEVHLIKSGKIKNRNSIGRYRFNTDNYEWWECRYSYDAENNSISGLFLNINKLKLAEQELIESRIKAEESDRMKTAFLANISHEIRTPLNAIMGFTDLITNNTEELSEEEKKMFLNIINTNCELLLKLFTNMMDLSMLESRKIKYQYTTCNLNKLLNELYQTHQLFIPNNISLDLHLPNETHCIQTDTYRLRQVMNNLIINAIKFTHEGFICLGYHETEDKKHICLYVEDSGIGIPLQNQSKIFDRFFKLNEFSQGSGLGLSICKMIVTNLEGEIRLKSEEGKGSRFSIYLPIKQK